MNGQISSLKAEAFKQMTINEVKIFNLQFVNSRELYL